MPELPFPERHAALDCCDLTTVGRVTGRPHRIEIWFGLIGSTMYLVAGTGERCDWLLNAVAEPSVIVDLGGETWTGTARRVDDPVERRTAGEMMGARYPSWQGDPDIGLTRSTWMFDVPLLAIEHWRRPA